MLAKDRFLKKQINLILILIIFFIIFFSKNLVSGEIKYQIETYLKNLSLFSSSIIQSDNTSIEEGFIYIKDGRIRLDYLNPYRTLKISQKKGVYINHDLEEEEFFSVEKSIVKIFYDIFLNFNFFSSLVPKESKSEIIFEKIITVDEKGTNLKIIFEKNPLVLRKIVAKSEGEALSISFSDHNYNTIFENNFFSFVPIYPK